MIWKIHLLFLLSILQSFAFRLPQVKKRNVSSTPSVTYEKDVNSKVLSVLKKVYSELNNVTDSGQRGNVYPRTYGLSLAGQQGFMWNMLNDARSQFGVGANIITDGNIVKQNSTTEKSIISEEAAEPQESEGSMYLQLLSELLENDEFWDWVSGWIETYTELLHDHIKVEVNESVSKQIKEYFDNIDYLINEGENTDIQESEQSSGQDDKGPAGSGAGGVQNITNSTLNYQNITNIYFTDKKTERTLIDKLPKAIVGEKTEYDKT